MEPRIQTVVGDVIYWADGRHNITNVWQKAIDYFA